MKRGTRKYFQAIGAKGGRAGAGTALRKIVARSAAIARWANRREKNHPDFHITWSGSTISISPLPPKGLLDRLAYYDRNRPGGKFEGRWVTLYTLRAAGGVDTHSGFLETIVQWLESDGAKVEVSGPSVFDRQIDHEAAKTYAPEHERLISALLRNRTGAVAVVPRDSMTSIGAALALAFPTGKTLLVVPTLCIGNELHGVLSESLGNTDRTVGFLGGAQAEDGDVVVMTAASLAAGVIPPESVQTLIFVNAPRNGAKWLEPLVGYWNATKFALLTPRDYPKPQRIFLEAVFGPVINGHAQRRKRVISA